MRGSEMRYQSVWLFAADVDGAFLAHPGEMLRQPHGVGQ